MRARAESTGAVLAALTMMGAAPVLAAPHSDPGDAHPQQVVIELAPDTDPAAVGESLGVEPVVGVSPSVEHVSVDAPPGAVERLRADPRIGNVFERGTTVSAALSDSVPLVGAPGRWAAGYDGTGGVIAIIDTGADAAFGGDLVGSACFAATETSLGVLDGHCGPASEDLRAFDALCFEVGLCGPGDTFDAAAGRPCAPPGGQPNRDCMHGTAVAAVAARRGPVSGVAPGAQVYAVRVFDPTGRNADLVDLYGALEHVYALHVAGVEIAAVNLSVATQTLFSSACDGSPALAGAIPAFRSIVAAFEARKIPVVTAAGNDGDPSRLAFPACLSRTVSVGSTDLDDDLAPFSNAGAGLDLLAPGVDEASNGDALDIPSAPGAPEQWAGTSFSAPHVAGALAVLDGEYPHGSVAQHVWALRTAGAPVATSSGTRWRMGLRPPSAILHAGLLFPGYGGVGGGATPALGDFDGDGAADLLAHAPGSPIDRVSYGSTDWGFDTVERNVRGTYLPLVGAFHGDPSGPDDVLWYAAGPAADSLWPGRTNRTFGDIPQAIGGTYEPHVGDFDGDGWDDILWYAPGPASDYVWYGGSASFVSRGVRIQGDYRIAVGDFDGDSRSDIVFHGPGAAMDSMWTGTAARGAFGNTALTITGSRLAFVLDANGDDVDDLFLYTPGVERDPLWLGGTTGFSPVSLSVQGTYAPVVADLDGNGMDDVTWYAAGSAPDSVWLATGGGGFSGRSITVNGSYVPQAGDVDASGSDDLIWYSTGAVTVPVWWTHIG